MYYFYIQEISTKITSHMHVAIFQEKVPSNYLYGNNTR
jgi:hypothetical protein